MTTLGGSGGNTAPPARPRDQMRAPIGGMNTQGPRTAGSPGRLAWKLYPQYAECRRGGGEAHAPAVSCRRGSLAEGYRRHGCREADLVPDGPLGAVSDVRRSLLWGSVSNVEMPTPMALICKALFPSISTFETPPPFNVGCQAALGGVLA